MSDESATPTPKHLWVVGILGFLWDSMGAFDYIMTQTQNESYMQQFTPEQLEFFYGFPVWVVSLWAIAVWGSPSAPDAATGTVSCRRTWARCARTACVRSCVWCPATSWSASEWPACFRPTTRRAS